jgi:hypothetical protein
LARAVRRWSARALGGWIGTRFIGFDWGLLHRTLIVAATSFLAAFAAAASFAWLAA